MGLALSSQAVPELELDALDAACRERGLDGEEVVLSAGDDPERLPSSGVRIVALRVDALDASSALAFARASARLQVPVSVPAEGIAPDVLPAVAAEFTRLGGRLLLAQGSRLDEMVTLVERIRGAAGRR